MQVARQKDGLNFDFSMNIIYESDSMADEHVNIFLQHKKRKGRALTIALSRSLTVRGLPIDEVFERLRKTFHADMESSKVGLYERPEELVQAQLQQYIRDPASSTLRYAGSKSLTIPNVSLTTALRRIKAAFAKPKT
jgi:hypothetical protein